MKQFIATTFLCTLLGTNAVYAHTNNMNTLTLCEAHEIHSGSCGQHHSLSQLTHVKLPQYDHEIEYLASVKTSVHTCKKVEYTAHQVSTALVAACSNLSEWQKKTKGKRFGRLSGHKTDIQYEGLKRLPRRAKRQLRLRKKKDIFVFPLNSVPAKKHENGFTTLSIVLNKECNLIDVVSIRQREKRIQISSEIKYRSRYSLCKYPKK